MTWVRVLAIAAITLGLSACSADKESMSMFLAKEMCSCRFLVGQSESHCRGSIRLGLAVGDVIVDLASKEVTGQAEDGSSPVTFKFVSEKFGCELKP